MSAESLNWFLAWIYVSIIFGFKPRMLSYSYINTNCLGCGWNISIKKHVSYNNVETENFEIGVKFQSIVHEQEQQLKTNMKVIIIELKQEIFCVNSFWNFSISFVECN